MTRSMLQYLGFALPDSMEQNSQMAPQKKSFISKITNFGSSLFGRKPATAATGGYRKTSKGRKGRKGRKTAKKAKNGRKTRKH